MKTKCLRPNQTVKKKESDDIFLSVIIPTFDKEGSIEETLSAVKDYLQTRDFSSEIIVADKGNYDHTTEIIKTLDCYVYDFKEQRSAKVKRSIEHLGSGFSMIRSVLRSRGKYVLCTDEGLSIPISEMEKLWPHVQGGAKIVVAVPKRQVAQQCRATSWEKLRGDILVQLIAVSGGLYRQCKFKLFERESACMVARAQKLYDRSFDLEQLYLARSMGFRITWIPVEWPPEPQAKSIYFFFDLLRVLWAHRGFS